ncbi:enoyl-CoA hydratase/isomerase family protein [Phycicoccus endophyticus]|uniref:Enoyl-CoA hydratase/isomerase family protein n=1 Tax=Phycicoccus endophyticus TaxID=1690220 RepID=A0A7G9R0X7_9MICO|nr:enoyl-CoA hydratase-related protein [Phycicoccus endophyticus]NHI19546.1 enoyl-CoA hydratase [Phycicoccus endophyticus]QNN49252.1 enoyl-CoA hydratase/isomerase family protein [Phycicoccus endophyticus]GGL39991.1 putative enoyl-CoA hydratase/isomerase [Phycicoccus endophyticus]
MDADAPLVRRETEDRVAVLTLDSPGNRNALSRRLLAELTEQVGAVAADESLHGVLLRSSQRVFCAGADLKEAATVDMTESARAIVEVQRRLVALPVPVVARLDGPVRAGGLGLVASSDLVLCREDVTFALTEVRLGLAAATISIPLRARLAPRAAADWFLTGRQVDAAQAREAGLVTHVEPAEGMDAAVAAVLADLRAGARQGLVAAKQMLTEDLLAAFARDGEAMARLSGELFHSPLAQERMAAALRR